MELKTKLHQYVILENSTYIWHKLTKKGNHKIQDTITTWGNRTERSVLDRYEVLLRL